MSFPDEISLNERDGRYLRKAVAWSHAARRRGNHPFGALIVSGAGEVLAEAPCNSTETGDCTGHAEINAIRLLAPRRLGPEVLAGCTLYSSAEPCLMCTGAIACSAIGRVVYGIDAQRLRALRGGEPVTRGHGGDRAAAGLSCRGLLGAAAPDIECIGPALVDEASAAHVGAWME